METWKIVYSPTTLNNGRMGVALIEAYDRAHAIHQFQIQYAGQYHTVDSCTKLFG